MDLSSAPVPTFLLLGAPKCGTTSLAFYLGQHPDICFSEPKEPVFFESEYEKGLGYYREKYFRDWRGEPVSGEGRVWNLYLPFVPARIREALPDARLVALLRDPVERVYSHWWHRTTQGQESLPFERAIAVDRARIERGERFEGAEGERHWRSGLYRDSATTRHRVLLDVGFYAEQLERYRALFPDARLKVLLYDDLVAEPAALRKELFAFLDADPDVSLEDTSARNVRRERIRSPLARRLSFGVRALGLRKLVPRAWRASLRQRLAGRAAQQPPLASALRRELVAYYEPHTERLERLLGRDLSRWRNA